MIEPISNNIPPELRATYKQEFARGAKLFQESLTAYETTSGDEAEKKAKFKDVMDQALKIMNESARGFLSARGQKQEAKLESDYQSFLHNDTPDNYRKLNNDLKNLKEFT